MTRKSGDRPLKELERRFQALRDQVGALPEAGRAELETALREVSRAIAALRADRGSPPAEAPDCPEARDAPAPADAILRHVFSAIPDMLTVIDRDFNITMTNWHESGMVPEEARRGQPKCYRVFHHRDRPCKGCHVHQVFASGKPHKTEKINLLDGKTREFSAFPVLSESGQVILAAEHVRDVTGRHQAAKALKESEERFRAIFEAAQDAIFIKDRSLHYTQVNPAMERLFDRPAADLVGKTDKDLFGASAGAQIRTEDRRVLSGEVVIAVNTRLVGGESKTFHVVKAPLHDDAGQVLGICGIARDITDLKRAEAALRESEEKYRVLFEGSTHGILAVDLETGRFGYANPSICRMLGYSERELLQLGIADIHPKDSLDQVMVDFESLARNEENLSVAIPCRRKDGTVFYADVASAQSLIQGRRYAVGFFMDVTERRRAEEALVRNHAELQETAQRLEQSRNMLQLIIESIPVRVFWKDRDLRYRGCNSLFARDAGLDHPEQLLGQDDFAMGWREQAEFYREDDRQVMESLRPKINLVEPQTTPAGDRIWLKTSKVPLQMPDGEVFGVLGLYEDITAHKQAEEALEKREVTLRTLIEANPESLFLLDTRGVILAASRVAAQRLDKSLEEILGADVFALVPTEEGQRRSEIFRQVVATGSPVRFEDVRGDFHLDISMTPIFSQKEVVQVAVLAVDITFRKQAEEALRESEKRFRDITENAAEWVWEMDAQGRYTYSSPMVEQLLGYKPKEILGKYFYDFFLPEVREELANAARAAFDAKQPLRDFLNPNLHKNGQIVWLSTGGIPLLDEKGNLLGYRGADIDISRRKQAEEALKESEARYRALFEASPDAITVMDTEMNFIMANRRGVEIWGIRKPDEASSSAPGMEYIVPEDRPRVMAAMQELLTTGRPQTFETTMIKRDGHRFPSLNSAALIRDAAGRPRAIIGVARDVTGLRQAETELRESERRFRLMAETIQDAFWIATPALDRVIYASPAYEQVWGYSCQELYEHPQHFVESIHPEDRERALAAMAAAREQGSPSNHEYRIIKPDGVVRWIHDRGFPIRDEQGRVTMFTGVARDITESKALEQQLLQAQKMEAVGRLAGGIAHDFNNLLMAITGYGELMRSKVLKDDPLYSHLENILKAGDRATALTQQLLTFSRQKIVHPQVVDFNRVVLDLEPMLRRLIGEDLDLEVVTDPRPGAVKADPGQLGQIVMNLVVNARDALPQGGRLTLKTAPVDFTVGCHSRFGLTPSGPYVKLEVHDTGVGMDDATQAHIFEPFFTTKEPGKGTGLGLSTVYGIVKQSGGYLDLESSPGAGSTFTIYLPRLEGGVEPSKAKLPITATFRGEETVLLVEDEDVLRGLLAKFLRLYGYTVLEARHGGEALLTCERHPGPIHLMVTDVVMPQMSGRELAERLTPLRPEMKIIYMSGYTEDALVQHGVADLSVAFLQKPFKPVELARRVRAVLHPPVSR